jgi:hypothetical protein
MLIANGAAAFPPILPESSRKPWRFWRFACPVPTIDTKTGEVVGWHLPDCGHRDTVICETDSVI